MLAKVVLGLVRRIPLIVSTIFNHYIHGPPQPSWSLSVHLTVVLLRSIVSPYYGLITIEDIQNNNVFVEKTPSDMKVDEIIIPFEHRNKAQVYIEKLVKPYNIVIDPIWKTPKDDLKGDLIMSKDWDGEDDWEKEKIVIYLHGGAFAAGDSKMAHSLYCKISRASGARVLSVNFRLAPQNPFPAALCDTFAAYLYLMDPPKDSGLKPYKPEQIVLCGDSSGAALAFSLGLMARDLGLPLPAGLVALSPWFDLTHSMPSFSDPSLDESDILETMPGYKFPNDTTSKAYREFRINSEKIIKNIQQHPEIKLIGDESLKRIGNQSISFYVANEGLGIPYVSPMLAESLGGLPPMLIVAGDVERLRDEAIYLAYRASNPEKYRLPKYEVDFDNSHFKSPSKKVILELYDELFHTFQLFPLEASKVSIRRIGEFISNAVQEALLAKPTSNKFETYKMTYQGEVQDLDESSIENVLKWDKVGVFPGV